MTKIEKLIQIIKDHGFDAYEYSGIIIATSPAMHNGTLVEITERVEPNTWAVKSWLGY